jgi:hypothetical protein
LPDLKAEHERKQNEENEQRNDEADEHLRFHENGTVFTAEADCWCRAGRDKVPALIVQAQQGSFC